MITMHGPTIHRDMHHADAVVLIVELMTRSTSAFAEPLPDGYTRVWAKDEPAARSAARDLGLDDEDWKEPTQ